MHGVGRVAGLLVWLAGANGLLPQTPKKPDPAAIEGGRSQFKSSCGFCHGDDATGNRAPDLVRSATVTLWHVNLGGRMVAPPTTFELNGHQYLLTPVQNVIFAWKLP
jgi:mono/diheme cytochrome c family protein